MGAADMDVIKEIPGYKVILKAVVKAQIQQLVEQLAAHTDEESVILTASVQDGTISHIGSDSGKSFLQGHEDFKSQFLGFCLKDHHRRKQQEEEEKQRKEQEQLQEQLQQQQQRQQAMLAGVQRFSPIRQSRPQPYPLTRPPGLSPRQRFSTPRAGPGPRSQGLVMPGAEKLATVKSEPKEIDETSNQSGLSAGSQSEISGNIKTDNSNDVSETGDNIPTENSQGITEQGSAKGEGNDADTEMGEVKLEALTDEDLELEITGVELGSQSSGSEVWDPNVSAGMFPDLSGAVGSSGDMQGTSQAGYNDGILEGVKKETHFCTECKKVFTRKSSLKNHVSIHGSYDFTCEQCGKKFHNKQILKQHVEIHVKNKNVCPQCGKSFSKLYWLHRHEEVVHQNIVISKFQCDFCGKKCSSRSNLRAHAAKHSADKPHQCEKCGKSLLYIYSLKRHTSTCDTSSKKAKRQLTSMELECEVCNKKFVGAKLLKQHKRIHEEPRYDCPRCGEKYKWKNCLDIHFKLCSK